MDSRRIQRTFTWYTKAYSFSCRSLVVQIFCRDGSYGRKLNKNAYLFWGVRSKS